MSTRKLSPQEKKLRRWRRRGGVTTRDTVHHLAFHKAMQQQARKKKLAWIYQTVKEFHDE